MTVDHAQLFEEAIESTAALQTVIIDQDPAFSQKVWEATVDLNQTEFLYEALYGSAEDARIDAIRKLSQMAPHTATIDALERISYEDSASRDLRKEAAEAVQRLTNQSIRPSVGAARGKRSRVIPVLISSTLALGSCCSGVAAVGLLSSMGAEFDSYHWTFWLAVLLAALGLAISSFLEAVPVKFRGDRN